MATRVMLEAEMCTTGQRKRRQRANRDGDPLDQLHGTSSPPLRAVPRPFDVALPRCSTPIGGTPALTIGRPLYDPQAGLAPYSG
jgi:hypothetical protein